MAKNKEQMLEEIKEQGEVLKQIAFKYIKGNKVLFPELKDCFKDLAKMRRVLILACGSSRHAGLLAELYFEELANLNAEVEFASEYRLKNLKVSSDTLVIAITQSGDTKDTIEAFKKIGDQTLKISVVNNPSGKIKEFSDVVIDIGAGEELSLAATKTFTAQSYLLLLLALYLGKRKGTFLNEIKKAPERVRQVLKKEEEAKGLARKLKKYNELVVVGRKYTTPIAFEEALKLKETSFIHAEGFPMGEFMHGPVAILDKDMPIIAIIPDDRYLQKNKAMLKTLHERQGEVIVVSEAKDKLLKSLSDELILMPKTNQYLYPLVSVVFLQLLAYYLAKYKKVVGGEKRGLKKALI